MYYCMMNVPANKDTSYGDEIDFDAKKIQVENFGSLRLEFIFIIQSYNIIQSYV
jgi:hypothetical protein